MLTTYRSGDVPYDEDTAPWVAMHDYQTRVIATEDYRAASTAQRNLNYAPSGHSVVYGSNELSVQNFERCIAELVDDPDADADGASLVAKLVTGGFAGLHSRC